MFYTVAAVAEATGLSKSTILGAIESGQITATRDLSGEWAIAHSDLQRRYVAIGEHSIDIDGAQQNSDAANIAPETEDLTQDVGDSLRQSCEEGDREPHDGCYQAQQWSVASAPTPEATWALPSALIAATLLAALGLCWIWGWSSYLFVGLPASMSLKQNLKHERIGTIPAASSRHTKPGVQYSPKLTTTTAAHPGDARASQVSQAIDRSNLVGPATAEHAIKIRRGGRRGDGDDLISADSGSRDEAKHNRGLDGP